MMPVCQALDASLCKPMLPTAMLSLPGEVPTVQKCYASSHHGLSAKLLFYVVSVRTCSQVLLSHDKQEVFCLKKLCNCYLTWTVQLPSHVDTEAPPYACGLIVGCSSPSHLAVGVAGMQVQIGPL